MAKSLSKGIFNSQNEDGYMENQFELLREQYELLENKYAEKSFKFLKFYDTIPKNLNLT